MTDTSPEIELLYKEMWKKVPRAERLRMGCEMFSTAKELATAGIRKELGYDDPNEIRRRLFLRFYGTDFTPEELNRILHHLDRAEKSQDSDQKLIEFPKELKKSISYCVSHAKDLLEAAIRESEFAPNIAFHLATLSLEEIGKAELLMISFASKLEKREDNYAERKMDDHVRKIFHAIWGPYFSENSITKEQVHKLEGMATNLHTNRMRGLYVDVSADSPIHPRDAIHSEEAKQLISLVSALLSNEKFEKRTVIPKEYQEIMRWFLTTTNDPIQRIFINSHISLDKLTQSGNPYEWMRWLKSVVDEQEDISRSIAEKNRTPPSKEEVDKPKWELKIRIYTDTHTVDQKSTVWWNTISPQIKINPVPDNKGQMICTLILPKMVLEQDLSVSAHKFLQSFLCALNIGTSGYFWNQPILRSQNYYESITDLENKALIKLQGEETLHNFKKIKLNEHELRKVAIVLNILPRDSKLIFFANGYLSGLGYFYKINIYYRFELPAFHCFYEVLKFSIDTYKDSSEVFETVLMNLMKKINLSEIESKRLHEMGENALVGKLSSKSIKFKDIGIVKLLCDTFIFETFQELAKKELSQKKPNEEKKN